MRSRVHLLGTGLAAVMLGAGCSTLTGLDALTESACASCTDAGHDSEAAPFDAGPADTTVAETGFDAGPPPDVATPPADVVAEPEAAPPPPPFCAAQTGSPVFCADFDEGQPVASGWSGSLLTQGASLATDATFARSLPRSMAAKTPAGSTDNGALLAALIRTLMLPAAPGMIHLAFDLRIGAIDPNVATKVGILAFDVSGSQVYALSLLLTSGGGELEETVPVDGGFVYPGTQLTSVPAAGTWTHVDMDLSFVTAMASVSFDGVLAAGPAPLTPGYHSGVLTVQTGLASYYGGTTGPASIDIDNVRVDAK